MSLMRYLASDPDFEVDVVNVPTEEGLKMYDEAGDIVADILRPDDIEGETGAATMEVRERTVDTTTEADADEFVDVVGMGSPADLLTSSLGSGSCRDSQDLDEGPHVVGEGGGDVRAYGAGKRNLDAVGISQEDVRKAQRLGFASYSIPTPSFSTSSLVCETSTRPFGTTSTPLGVMSSSPAKGIDCYPFTLQKPASVGEVLPPHGFPFGAGPSRVIEPPRFGVGIAPDVGAEYLRIMKNKSKDELFKILGASIFNAFLMPLRITLLPIALCALRMPSAR